jgi:hypothetical protein
MEIYLFPAGIELPPRLALPRLEKDDFWLECSEVLNSEEPVMIWKVSGEQLEFLMDVQIAPPADYKLIDPKSDEVDFMWSRYISQMETFDLDYVEREAKARNVTRQKDLAKVELESPPDVRPEVLEDAGYGDVGDEEDNG